MFYSLYGSQLFASAWCWWIAICDLQFEQLTLKILQRKAYAPVIVPPSLAQIRGGTISGGETIIEI